MFRSRCLPTTLLWLVMGAPLYAAPPGFVVETVLADADFPVAMAWAPDGRLFFNELMSGRIRILQDGELLPEPFAELSVGSLGEKGLLGLALHPEFNSNGYVYVCYTREDGFHEIVH